MKFNKIVTILSLVLIMVVASTTSSVSASEVNNLVTPVKVEIVNQSEYEIDPGHGGGYNWTWYYTHINYDGSYEEWYRSVISGKQYTKTEYYDKNGKLIRVRII